MSKANKKKRSRSEEEGEDESEWQVGESSGNQILPVAILPADFDGIPLDGSQYLAVVRKEARAAPSIARCTKYVSVEDQIKASIQRIDDDDNLLPPSEWRNSFLQKFKNMRESLRYRVQLEDDLHKAESLPKGRSAKKWFRYLHGSEPSINEYSEEEEELMEKNDQSFQATPGSKAGNMRAPNDSLLRTFETTHILILLSNFTIWLDEDWFKPKGDSANSPRTVIEQFHSQWLFALLAHLDEQLVGDDISVLRQLARSCIHRIANSRRKQNSQSRIDMESEQGCWIIICVIAGVWGQYDLIDDAHDILRQSLAAPR